MGPSEGDGGGSGEGDRLGADAGVGEVEERGGGGVGELVDEAVTHPLETVGMVWTQAKATVAAVGKVVSWAQKQVLEK